VRAARLAFFASALLFLAFSGVASAAVRPVDIAGFAFTPQSVTITTGDTVTWTNKDAAAHSARVPGVGTTPVLSQGRSASLQFMAAGTFSYDCGVHGASMTGTVIVRAAAPPPPPPTQQPTPVPTQRPTVPPTIAPTSQPTVAPTTAATEAPTPTAAPTTAAPTAAATSAAPTVAVAAPTEQAAGPGAQGGPDPLPVLAAIGGALVLFAIGATLFTRSRR
jgi:plastocyanin